MFNKKTKKDVVYSSTDLSDLLSSPVFYSVIALTFILGLSSIFGFFNNPRKLKTVVDVISQKILINPNSNTVSFEADADYLLRNYSLDSLPINLAGLTTSNHVEDPYNISSQLIILNPVSNVKNYTRKVSLDYDITSKRFWDGLDDSRLEAVIEESQRQNSDSLTIGAPLSTEYLLEEGDSKYSMRASILRL